MKGMSSDDGVGSVSVMSVEAEAREDQRARMPAWVAFCNCPLLSIKIMISNIIIIYNLTIYVDRWAACAG